MADFQVILTEVENGNRVGTFRPENLSFSIRNSEAGSINFELPLSEPNMKHELFGPYRTDYELRRAGQSGNFDTIVAGMITSVNLSGDRDTVLLGGKDWLHYLERRIYPFNPEVYVGGGWVNWPKGWPRFPGGREKLGPQVDVREIVEDILDDMQQEVLPPLPGGITGGSLPNQLPISFNNPDTGTKTRYKIYPGDSTTVFEHIQKLSEQVDGFEFDITPVNKEFKMWSPDRLDGLPIYRFQGDSTEIMGQFSDIDWTNDGPDGTFLVGLGTSQHKAGSTWYYKPSIDRYRMLEKVYDFGEMQNTDLIFQLLKDQNDLYPQRKLSLTLLNPEFLSPSFYSGGRPRGVIGRSVNVIFNFPPYWEINSQYRVNALNWTVDQSSNESVEFELEILYEEDPFSVPHGAEVGI